MKLPVYTSLAIANRHGRVSPRQVGEVLAVDRRLVHMWAKRRKTTGFPDAVAFLSSGSKLVPLYRKQQVEIWSKNWIARKTG